MFLCTVDDLEPHPSCGYPKYSYKLVTTLSQIFKKKNINESKFGIKVCAQQETHVVECLLHKKGSEFVHIKSGHGACIYNTSTGEGYRIPET